MDVNKTNKERLGRLFPFLSVFLGACAGGGSGSGSSASGFSAIYSGAAIKGPLENATAFVDYDGDGVLDADEPSVSTGADGSFSLATTQVAPIVVLTDATTIDNSTGNAIGAGIVLKAPAGASVVSPTTTLVANGASEAQVKAALGLSSSVDLNTFNPFAAGADATEALAYEKASVQIFATISAVASAAQGAGANQADAQAAAFSALASAVTNAAASSAQIDLTNAATVSQVIASTSTSLAGQINATAFQASATQVAAAISNTNTAVAALNSFTSSAAMQTIAVATTTLGEQVKAGVQGVVNNPGSTVQIGLSDANQVASTISSANLAPTDLALSANSILESSQSLVVATVAITDGNPSDSHTLTLGGADAALFTLSGTTLSLKSAPDYEVKASYTISITATDAGNKSYSESFTISVGDVNDAPVLAAPVSMAITEDASSSAVSGALSATDPEGATLSYQLVNGTLASGSYTLTGTYGTLVLNGATGSYTYTLNNSAQATNALAGGASASESFGVRVSDGSNTTASQNLVINITGANDAPVIGSGRTATVAENTATSTVLYAPDVSDVDTGDTKTYALSGPDASYFNINATTGAVTLKSAANYEVKASYQFIVSVTDSAGAIDIQGVTLSVTNVAEAYSGTIVDGYVAGATVFQDLNNNNVLDSGEPNAVTNAVGQFSLAGVVSSANAPIKMITGFDIGTNAPIVTTLGAPSGVVGAAIASPLSTITSLASANQPDVSLDNVVARLGSYVGLSGSTLQTLSLLTDDPIAKLLSTNSGETAAAKELFAANQLMMSMSHITGAVTKYIAEQVDSDIQTYLSSQGVNNVDALGSLDAYEKVGTDAVFSQVAQAIAAPTVASENVFQLKSNFVSLIDYNPATGETATHRIGLSTDANVATIAFNNGALNQQNLANAVNNSGSYQSPYINVELQKIASGSGSTSVTVKLVDGADGTRSGGECPTSACVRQIGVLD
ncbi:beta strand repeat-containing protein [Rheinheimera sp.]|uniref:beta strand repeat-containing protein n=1 Tax=Rheinheimera sp. TaxID=1869214 RepID=UPI0040475986